jgi:hypothetical protein
MIPSIFAIWRAVIHIAVQDMTHAETMKSVNDAFFLAHRLAPHSVDPNIFTEMERLSLCGNAWFDQELVDMLININ